MKCNNAVIVSEQRKIIFPYLECYNGALTFFMIFREGEKVKIPLLLPQLHV